MIVKLLTVYVGPLVNTTEMLCAPVLAPDGIVNVAMTCPAVLSEMLVPAMLPANVTLVIGAPAGGFGGELGSVIVTVTVVPRAAVPPGATVLIVGV